MTENLIRDALEGLIVVAVGGILFSSVKAVLHGRVHIYRCPSCQRPNSRAYSRCPSCGAAQLNRL